MNTLLILDEASGEEVQRCSGPAPDGSSPRVSIGDILPCAGYALRPADTGAGQRRYSVSGQATLCPVTIAAALAVTPDTLLTLDE
jgi:hypothetical protein